MRDHRDLELDAAIAEVARLREAYAHLQAALSAADHRGLDRVAARREVLGHKIVIDP